MVRIILGDNNLDSQQVQEALQRATDHESVWTVVATTADLRGDNMAVCGAVARFVPIAIGASCEDCGIRHDAHGALAVGIFPHRGESKTGDEIEDTEASDLIERVVRWSAQELHHQMREFWDQSHDDGYDPKVLLHLSRLLFMKRKDAQPAEEDVGTAFASQQETARAIASVLRVRHDFLRSNKIDDPRHVLTDSERQELVQRVQKAYWQTPRQRQLERRDAAAAEAAGKSPPKGKRSQGTQGARGAPQPAQGKKSNGKGKGIGSVAKYVKEQKHKRWQLHLQCVCGSKQIWELLAFTGGFDVHWLERALHAEADNASTPPHPREEAAHQHRRRLHHAKAEAIARCTEGERRARHRAGLLSRGASQPAGRAREPLLLTRRQVELLEKYRNDELRAARNHPIIALGHDQLHNRRGHNTDVGGSTGGVSRRIIDSWKHPDFREFLEEEHEEWRP